MCSLHPNLPPRTKPAAKLAEPGELMNLPPVVLETGWDAKCEIRMHVSMFHDIPRSLHAIKL